MKLNAGGVLALIDNFVELSNVAKGNRELVPAFGVFLTLAPAYNQKSILYSLEIIFANYKSTSDTLKVNSTYSRLHHMNFPQVYFSPLLRFYLSHKKPNFFIEPGISVSNWINGKVETESFANGVPQGSSTKSYSSQFQMSVLAGFGVEFNRVSIQARYCTNISGNTDLNYFGIVAKISVF